MQARRCSWERRLAVMVSLCFVAGCSESVLAEVHESALKGGLADGGVEPKGKKGKHGKKEHPPGHPDGDGKDGGHGPISPRRVFVNLGPLTIEMPDGEVVTMDVDEVEVDVVPEAVVAVARRGLAPPIEVEIPPSPARRALTPVTVIEDEAPCPPVGVPRRVANPAIEVDVPEDAPPPVIPRRVAVPPIDVDVPPGFVATRARIPVMDQDVPTPTGPRRVLTPAIAVDMPPAEGELPTRVRVFVPTEAEDTPTRVRVPVSEPKAY